MTIQTIARAKRAMLSLPFGGGKPFAHTAKQHCASKLSTAELRHLVASMVD